MIDLRSDTSEIRHNRCFAILLRRYKGIIKVLIFQIKQKTYNFLQAFHYLYATKQFKDMTKVQLTQELVNHLFDYNDGFLYYKNKLSRHNTVKIGDKAGSLRPYPAGDRYVIKVLGKSYLSSRLILFYHKGWWPEFVDHEDRDCLNDRIGNLRPATKSENAKNAKSRTGSTSQYLGVCLFKGKWVASIWINNSSKQLGKFEIEYYAALAYNKAAVRYHGEFANLNIIQP